MATCTDARNTGSRGDYTVENAGPLPVWDYLGPYGSIHEQLRDVPNGSQVVLRVADKPAESPR